jgi:hypothetical protein
LTARLTIAPDARPGERDVLVVSPAGPSNKLVFLLRPVPGSPEPLIYNVTLKFPPAEGTKATITGSFDFEDANGDILFTGVQQGSAGIHYYLNYAHSLESTVDWLMKSTLQKYPIGDANERAHARKARCTTVLRGYPDTQ